MDVLALRVTTEISQITTESASKLLIRRLVITENRHFFAWEVRKLGFTGKQYADRKPRSPASWGRTIKRSRRSTWLSAQGRSEPVMPAQATSSEFKPLKPKTLDSQLRASDEQMSTCSDPPWPTDGRLRTGSYTNGATSGLPYMGSSFCEANALARSSPSALATPAA